MRPLAPCAGKVGIEDDDRACALPVAEPVEGVVHGLERLDGCDDAREIEPTADVAH